MKVIWVSLIVYFDPEENSCLNVCVLLSHESIVATPDLVLVEFMFAKGLEKVKLLGAC